MRRMARGVGMAIVAMLVTACGPVVRFEMKPLEAVPKHVPEQSFVYDADGNQLAVLRTEFRQPVAIDTLPEYLLDAVLAAEDRRFRKHAGLDPRGILRAAAVNAAAGEIVQGGSTITQQLVEARYDLGAPPASAPAKTREALLALRLEQEQSKDAILEEYLNTVYFGNGAYGVEAAAWTYWRVSAADLDLNQSAILAGIIRSPERLDPADNPGAAQARRDEVIDAMVEEGWLPPDRAEATRAAPVTAMPPPTRPETLEPHWVNFVVRSLLADPAFGDTEDARARLLYGGGLRIHTTLDPRMQQLAREATDVLDYEGAPAIALTAVEPPTGRILAAVGGRDFQASQFDLATQGRRQPGSTFKTFVLTAAISQGMTPDTVVNGSQGVLDTVNGPWRLRNANGVSYPHLSLREATVGSVNAAFARLGQELGMERVAGTAKSMGVASPVNLDPPVAIGALDVGVTPLDMASAYATLASGGDHAPAYGIDRVETADSEVIWRPPNTPNRVLAPDIAHVVTDILEDVVTRGTGRRAQVPGRPVAGKTGTTDDNADAWFVGYTPQLSVAVWIGHPNSRERARDARGRLIQGGTVPAEVFSNFVAAALRDEPVEPFALDEAFLVTIEIDPRTGLLAAEWCPGEEQTMPHILVPRETCPRPPEPEPSATEVASTGPSRFETEPVEQPTESASEPTEGEPRPTRSPSPSPTPTPTPSASPSQ